MYPYGLAEGDNFRDWGRSCSAPEGGEIREGNFYDQASDQLRYQFRVVVIYDWNPLRTINNSQLRVYAQMFSNKTGEAWFVWSEDEIDQAFAFCDRINDSWWHMRCRENIKVRGSLHGRNRHKSQVDNSGQP
jgi:hypothetical protein